MAPGTPLSPEMQEAFQAVKEPSTDSEKRFKDAIAKTTDPEQLDQLARELLDAQERKELSISLAIRDAMRLRIEELHKGGMDLAVLSTKVNLNRLRQQTMLHDAREAIAPVTKKAGEMVGEGMEVLSKSDSLVGKIFREVKSIFGRNKEEVSKNIGEHVSKGVMHTLWSTLAQGDEKSFMTGWLVRMAKDHLQKEEVLTAINDAVSIEQEADADKQPPTERQNNVVFKGIDNYVWKKMSSQEKQSTDWKKKVHDYVESVRKADKSNGTKSDKPIVVTLTGIMNLEKEQKAMEAKKAEERTTAVKKEWALDDKAVVKFEGDKAKAKNDGGVWTLTLPNVTHVSDTGAAVTPEAKTLQSAIKQNIPGMQEIEISGTTWELRKADAGTGLRLTLPTGNDGLLPSLAALAPKLTGFVRAKAFKIDQSLPTSNPIVEFGTDNGSTVLKWNGIGEIDKLPQLFTDVAGDLQTKSPPAKWKFESGAWTAA